VSAGFDAAGICAHPDDAELVMGGTLALLAKQGRRLALVDLTRGESGSRGTPETRAAEAAEAARILGVAHRESLGLPDARLEVVAGSEGQARRGDPPPAAAAGAAAALGAAPPRPRRGQQARLRRLLPGRPAQLPERARRGVPPAEARVLGHHDGGSRRRTDAGRGRLVRVGDEARRDPRVREPVPARAGEAGLLPLDRFQAAIELSARRHGQRIGALYGEGFVTREPVAVQDLLSLGGSSF
jgi:hypothetical protein